MIKFLIWVLLTLFSFEGKGQLQQTNYFEFDVQQYNYSPDIINLGKDGLILLEQRNFPSNILEIKKLDSDLNPKWVKQVSLEQNYSFQKIDTLNNHTYALYSNDIYFREAIFITINNHNGNIEYQPFKNLIKIDVDEIIAFDRGDKIILAGYFNTKPIAVMYGIRANSVKVLPGFTNDFEKLITVDKDIEERSITICLLNSSGRNHGIRVNKYDYNAGIISTEFIGEYDHLYPQDILVGNKSGSDVKVGTYGTRISDYSRGFFIDLGENTIMYSLGDLDKFYNFYPLRKRNRIYKRIERRKSNSKKIRLSYRLNLRDFHYANGEYIVLADGYTELYSDLQSVYISPSPGLSRRGQMAFNGYEISHTVIMGFNGKGKLLWNDVLKIDENKQHNLHPISEFLHHNGSSVLAYNYKDRIILKAINNTSVVKHNIPAAFRYPGDEMLNEEKFPLTILPWYNNNFLIYGLVRLKNMDEPNVDLRRIVFSISKMEYSSK